MSSKIINTVGTHLVPYLELTCLTGDHYYFRKETTALRDKDAKKRLWHPRIKHKMLRDYHGLNEGILYVALPASAHLHDLKHDDLLYVGCSAAGGARFWRGRINETEKFQSPKSCFHHEQMRRGRDGSNLEIYLERYGAVVLHTITNAKALDIAQIHRINLPGGKYPAHQLERAILAEGYTDWKWNARA